LERTDVSGAYRYSYGLYVSESGSVAVDATPQTK